MWGILRITIVVAAIAAIAIDITAARAQEPGGNSARIPTDLFLPYASPRNDFIDELHRKYGRAHDLALDFDETREKIAALERDALNGDLEAKVALGDIHNDYPNPDRGRTRQRAAALYEEAANAGSSRAMVNLAVMNVYGEGIKRDIPRAIALFEHAAELADWVGLDSLSTAHEHGVGVPQNFPIAHVYAIAAESVSLKEKWVIEHFADKKNRLAQRMTPEQLAQSQALAANWKPGLIIRESGLTKR
jgi:TPR repeat protein